MKNAVLVLLLLVGSTKLISQVKEEKTIQLSGFSLQTGALNLRDNYGGSLEEFRKLVPSSTLLDNNLEDFNQSFYQNGGDYNGAFSGQLTFKWNTANSTWSELNPTIQLGFTFGNANLLSGSLYRENAYRIDTLISSQDGSEYYVDSVETENYYLDYNTSFLLLDANLQLGSNPQSTWSIYGGVGISAGLNFNSVASLEYYKGEYIDATVNYQNNPNYNNGPDYKEERFRQNEVGFSFLLSSLVGVNFRLSKTKQVWQNLVLFVEARPSVGYFNVPGIDNHLYSLTYSSFGVKYRLQ